MEIWNTVGTVLSAITALSVAACLIWGVVSIVMETKQMNSDMDELASTPDEEFSQEEVQSILKMNDEELVEHLSGMSPKTSDK